MEVIGPNFDGLVDDAIKEIADIGSLIIDEDGEAELRLTLKCLVEQVREATLDDLDLAELIFS